MFKIKLNSIAWLFCFCISSAFANNTNNVEETAINEDSINAKIALLEDKSSSLTDQDSFKLALNIAEYFLNNKPKDSIKYSLQAIDIANKLNKQDMKGQAYLKLGIATFRQSDYEKALEYINNANKIFQQLSDQAGLAESTLNICAINWHIGEYSKALDNCLQALTINNSEKNQIGIANAYHNIGIIYDLLKQYERALENHYKALEIRQALKLDKDISSSYSNIGIIKFFQEKYDDALEMQARAFEISSKINDQIGIAKSLNNIGLIYEVQNNYQQALGNYLQALRIWESTQNKYEVANTSNNLGKIYLAINDLDNALIFMQQGQKFAKEIEAKELIRENHQFLSKYYETHDNYKLALKHYQLEQEVKNQLFDEATSKKIAEIQIHLETQKKQKEIELLQKQNELKQLALSKEAIVRNSLFAGLLLVVLIAVALFRLYRTKQKTGELIRKVFGRYLSDEIVDNLLDTQSGLILGGERREITILTSDIRGFTQRAQSLPPEEVLKIINFYLDEMVRVINRYQGTIDEIMGDGMLILFGAPVQREDDAERALACAIDMELAMEKINQQVQAWGYPALEMGIGVHTGEVVVGNIGSELRTKYGVIGNEVNIAFRIESYSVGGQILFSENTLNKCKDKVSYKSCITVHPKGLKHQISIYELNGISGKFNLELQSEELIFYTLNDKLPLYFSLLEGKNIGEKLYSANLTALSQRGARIRCSEDAELPKVLSNIKLNMWGFDEIYAKVTDIDTDSSQVDIIFTATPSEVEGMLSSLYRKHSA